MPAILTTDSLLMCPHLGRVTLTAGQTRATAAGGYVIRPADASGISGCIFAPGGASHPCVTVEWSNPSQHASAGSKVLTEASVGICKAGDQAIQGAVLILQTQQGATAQ